jgi:hypothetical protein
VTEDRPATTGGQEESAMAAMLDPTSAPSIVARPHLSAVPMGTSEPGAVPLSAALAVYLDTLNSPHTRRAYARACRQLLDVVGHQHPAGALAAPVLASYRPRWSRAPRPARPRP